jgi:uncharacterized protein YkvS
MELLEQRKYTYEQGFISKDEVYQKLLDGIISPADYEYIVGEPPLDVPIDVLVQNKIAQVKLECQNKIYAGFTSTAKYGTPKHYTLKDYEQSNLQALMLNIMNGATTVPWRDDSTVICDIWTVDEFRQLYSDGNTFTINQRYKSDVIELYLRQETLSADEVASVSLDMTLPQAYQDILVDKLTQAGVGLWVE